MTNESRTSSNPYTSGSLPRLFVRTAAPIIVVMTVNGLFTVVDALFLGLYVGADALTAVTLMFPLFMLLVALSTLVGHGMASVLSRQLGAERLDDAQRTLVSAQALSIAVCAVLVAAFLAFGNGAIGIASNGDPALGAMGYRYISLLVFCSPLLFLLTVQGDALRSEGHVGAMAAIAAGSTVLNIVFNYVLIVALGMGVTGSALGTVMAQAVTLGFVAWLRLSGRTRLKLLAGSGRAIGPGWGAMLALGLPSSLGFLGISVLSGVVILSIQAWAADAYAETVAAYGVITRIMTFAFLPLMGLNLAAQSIVGNNFGAAAFDRSDAALRIALGTALAYCVAVETVLVAVARPIGALFVTDASVIGEVGRILPVMVATYVLFGPMMVLSGYFQALGDAGRAALLGLAKIWLFTMPLTALLPFAIGEWGIWLAGPASDLAMIGLTVTVLALAARGTGARFGLFRQAVAPVPVAERIAG